jgi:type IV secretion system protein TrbL
MNGQVLDDVTAAFLAAIQAGTNTLAQVSLPLLGILAIIAFYLQLGPLLASGSVGAGDAIASTLLTILKAGVFYWLVKNLAPLATAAFQTFFQWGLAPAGSAVATQRFFQPSLVMNIGFQAATPIKAFVDHLMGNFWSSNIYTTLTYWLAWLTIVVAFAFVALHLMMTIIEYFLAVLVAMVLLPWGVLQPTAFLSELSIGWVTGGLVRVLVTGAILGIATPLFALLKPAMTAQGDPTFYSALVTAITSLIFAILAWVIPGRAAAIAGRGVSLALHAGTLVAGAAGGGRAILVARQAIRGASQMLTRR